VISILGVVQQGPGVSIPPRRVALAMRDIAELSPVARAFVELAERWAKRRRPAR